MAEHSIPQLFIKGQLLPNKWLYTTTETEYNINGEVFTLQNDDDDEYFKFEVVSDTDSLDDTASAILDNEETEILPVSIKKTLHGIIVNNTILLSINSWNTIITLEDHIWCCVCINMDTDAISHIKSNIHLKSLMKYQPLEKFDLSIVRLIEDHYHCGVCNETFHISEDDHFNSKTHENMQLYAVCRCSDVQDILNNDTYPSLARSIEPSPLSSESSHYHSIEPSLTESSSESSTHSRADNIESFSITSESGIDFNGNFGLNDINWEGKDVGVSYASVAAAVPSLFFINWFGTKYNIDNDAWNMIITIKNNSSFYCMVCKDYDDIKKKIEHCTGEAHIENLKLCTPIKKYKEHIIRKVDNKFYHCGNCNNLQLESTIADHIEGKHSNKPKSKKKKKTKDETKPTGEIQNINTSIINNIQNNANECTDTESKSQETNDTKSKSQETNDTKSKSQETNDTKSKSQLTNDTKSKSQQTNDTKSKSQEMDDTKSKSQETNDTKSKSQQTNVTKSKSQQTNDTKSKSQQANDTESKCQAINEIEIEDQKVNNESKSQENDIVHRNVVIQAFGCNIKISLLSFNVMFPMPYNYYYCHLCNIPMTQQDVSHHLNDYMHLILMRRMFIPTLGVNLIRNVNLHIDNGKVVQINCGLHCALCHCIMNNNKLELSEHIMSPFHIFKLSNALSNQTSLVNINTEKQKPIEKENMVKIESNTKDDEASFKNTNEKEPNLQSDIDTSIIEDEGKEDIDPARETGVIDQELGQIFEDDVKRVNDIFFEKMLVAKLKNKSIKISFASYNTFVSVGNGCWYCAVCSVEKCNMDAHSTVDEHLNNLKKSPFIDKYDINLIRRNSHFYHCAICNVILTKNELQTHITYTEHVNKLSLSTKNRQRDLKNFKIIELSLAKERHFDDFTLDIKIVANYKFEGVNTTSVAKKNKYITHEGKIFKLTWDAWQGVLKNKNGYRCILCMVDMKNYDLSGHVKSERHFKLLKTFEIQYLPALIRKINEATFNCLTCNSEVSSKEHILLEHIRGKKHLKNHKAIVVSYTSHDDDVLNL